MTGIFRNELIAERRRETSRADLAQIVVEVAELRAKHESRDPGLACALAETFDTVPAGGVGPDWRVAPDGGCDGGCGPGTMTCPSCTRRAGERPSCSRA